MNVHPALRRVLVRAPSSAASPSQTATQAASSSRRRPSAAQSPFLPTKLANGRWQKPRYSARTFKHLFVATNYGRDIPEGFVFPTGPHGRAEKLLAREERRSEALQGDNSLLELARQHFPPSRASIQALGQGSARSQDRSAYLENKGPYSGRRLGDDGSKAFKGHVNERKRPQRQADVQARLAKMNMQYEAYNRNKADTKARRRPALPF